MRAIWKSHTRNVLSSPVPRSSKRGSARERLEEDLLGKVLGGMVIVEFVDGEAVHLAHVFTVERLEVPWIAAGSLDGRPVRVVGDETLWRRAPLLS